MMKIYYTAIARILPVLILFLIASAIATVASAQEAAGGIGIPVAAEAAGAAVQWDYKPILIAWAAAVAIGVGVVEFWKYKMNTVFLKKEADTYVVPNSLVFNVKKDSFLYSRVTKIRRQTKK